MFSRQCLERCFLPTHKHPLFYPGDLLLGIITLVDTTNLLNLNLPSQCSRPIMQEVLVITALVSSEQYQEALQRQLESIQLLGHLLYGLLNSQDPV